MKLLSKYDDYINELKILEALRTFPLYLSKRLRDILRQIDHEISNELLLLHSDTESRVKQTFVDIHEDKSDSITFIQPNKAMEVLGWDLSDDEDIKDFDLSILSDLDDNHALYKRFRSETKWGRFINATFPNKFPQSLAGGQNKKDIESFVNKYKSFSTRDEKFKMIDVVSGDDISYWYNCERYYDTRGSLGESCMRDVDNYYFDLYTKNPDKVSLIILYSDNMKDLIQARAILWKLDYPSDRYFMDRVYTNDYSDEQIFLDYAKKNGWFHKISQSMGNDILLVDTKTDEEKLFKLMVELKPIDHDYYPYLDTMTYYNPSTGKISNRKRYNPKYELVETDGSYYEMDDYDEEPDYVYSSYHNEEIDKNESKYCVYGDDWVKEEDAIRVWNSGGENYAVPGNSDIVLMDVNVDGDRIHKYFPKIKCVWSDYLNTWLFKWSAIQVWTNFDRTKYILDYKKKLGKEFFEINGEYWHKDLVDEDGNLKQDVPPKRYIPVGKRPKGWHLRKEYIDDLGFIFSKGKRIGRIE